jgi:ribosomal-protein-alanine N-acetyltransferase
MAGRRTPRSPRTFARVPADNEEGRFADLVIETERLRLRPLVTADEDDLHRLFTEPGVRRYLWDDEVISRERTASVVEHSITSLETDGYGLWAVFLKGAVPLVGFCGFWHFHDPPQLELLYGLGEEHWHQGLATEMAIAMMRHGFDVLRFDRIESSTDAANEASVRVMERAGMQFWKREITNGLDTIYYAVDRRD